MQLSDRFTLAAATADLDEEPVARDDADCVEFRMDLADDPLIALSEYGGELPILATNRPAWEGGAADDEGRLEALEAALEIAAVEAIDVELTTVERGDADGLLEAAAAADVDVVVSTHDFEATPSREELESRLRRADEYGDVAKVATAAHDEDDTLALLSVTRSLTKRGVPVATMGMGEAGRHTRVVAPLYGSKIGYAPVDPDSATAPGQYDLSTMRALIDALR